MKNYILFFCSLIQFSFYSYAQEQGTLSGLVIDEKGTPVEFVNIVLLHSADSTLVKAALTDGAGKYSFNNIDSGSYIIMASLLGYQKKYSPSLTITSTSALTSIPEITLEENAVLLKEANITTSKPLIEHKLDKVVVNVENSTISAGATALEVLRQSPGVSVDNQGNISLQGKQNVLVMIDGKPTYLSTQDLYNMLRNTSSDQVSQIEIITNPSSKYDAAGNSGIINFKMKKQQSLGMNGSARISYGQGAYPDFGIGFNLNYRNRKFNLFGGYDYAYGFYFEKKVLTRRFASNNSDATFILNTFDKGYYTPHNFRSGVDYALSKNQTIGIFIRGDLYSNHDRTASYTEIKNNSEQTDSAYTTLNKSDSKWNNIHSNINYRIQLDTLGTELTADLDYARFDNSIDYYFETTHYSPITPTYVEILSAQQPAIIDVKSAKVDYTHPFNKSMKIEGGMKTSFVTNDNDLKYYYYPGLVAELDPAKSNHFIYRENINAIYLNWASEYKKIGLQTGLRLEQTIAEGDQVTIDDQFKKNYVDLFPTIFLTYQYSENQLSKISYSKRIDRPGYGQLNPFRYYIDPYNYQEGNPLLQPQITNAFEVTHVYHKFISLSLKFSHTIDVMTPIAKQIDSTRTTYSTTENLNSQDHYGVSLNAPVQITKWWQGSNNLTVYNSRVEGVSTGGEIDKSITAFIFNSYNSFILPHGWAAELSGNYFSESYLGTILVSPRWSVSAGFRKSFLNDKWTLRINVNDIFHTDIFDSRIQYENIDVSYRSVYDSQFVRFHLMYNFGKRTVPRAKHHSTSSEEEENRINTGK